MDCEVQGCRNLGTIETNDGLLLCPSHAEQGIFLPQFAATPESDAQCECDVCLARRKTAVAVYGAAMALI